MAGEAELGEALLGAAVDASLSRGFRLPGGVHVAPPGEASTWSMARAPQGRAVAAQPQAVEGTKPPPPYEHMAFTHIWNLELPEESMKVRKYESA